MAPELCPLDGKWQICCFRCSYFSFPWHNVWTVFDHNKQVMFVLGYYSFYSPRFIAFNQLKKWQICGFGALTLVSSGQMFWNLSYNIFVLNFGCYDFLWFQSYALLHFDLHVHFVYWMTKLSVIITYKVTTFTFYFCCSKVIEMVTK